MADNSASELYSAAEIARAAGVPVERVVEALGRADALVPHGEALRLGRSLLLSVPRDAAPVEPSTLFSRVAETPKGLAAGRLPFALSGTVHAAVVATVILITTLGLNSAATTLAEDTVPSEPPRLVFMVVPGPGGGGGGGGRLQKAPPPKAKREGSSTLNSPLPVRTPPPDITPVPKPPDPEPPPPAAEPLPPVVAPIVAAPADKETRPGVLENTAAKTDSHGPGAGGGVGTGKGTGIGEGDGTGVGPGSGGGTGGGPYRPGSGVEPPRLLKEVKPDYTDDARRRGLAGEVVLEIIVRRDGTVGDVKVLKGLPAGLNDEAIEAVKQWRFAPARLRGTPVDVVVEASVEFRMR